MDHFICRAYWFHCISVAFAWCVFGAVSLLLFFIFFIYLLEVYFYVYLCVVIVVIFGLVVCW